MNVADLKPTPAERLILQRALVRVDSAARIPVDLMVHSLDLGVYHASGGQHEKPYLDVEGGGPVLLGASGLPCNAKVVEPVTYFDVTFTDATPVRADGEVLVLDGRHESVGVFVRRNT